MNSIYLNITYSLVSDLNTTQPNLLPIIRQIFSIFIIFFVVLILAYYSTKIIASSKQYNKKLSNNMECIDNLSIGYNLNMKLIRVHDKLILVAVDKDHITYITELENKQLDTDSNIITNNIKFEKYINDFSEFDIN